MKPDGVEAREMLAGTTILVIDDDRGMRQAVRRILAQADAQVLEASNAKEGLETARRTPPAAILLDVHMPGQSGLELCQELRQPGNTERIPIIVMTGQGDRTVHEEALRVGADDFVSKPFNNTILLRRLGNLVVRYRAERENARLLAELGRYVSEATRTQASHHRRSERIEAAILFSDLRGFTPTSFAHDLEQLFDALNTVLAQQTRIVQDHEGYIDKFSGDGLLAVFLDPDAALKACRAASDIVRWARDGEAVGVWAGIWARPPVAVGVHHGEVIRGDFGTEDRREFTVLGQNVNIAARLCGGASSLEALATETVREQAQGAMAFDHPRQLTLKGVPEPTLVYSLQVPTGI